MQNYTVSQSVGNFRNSRCQEVKDAYFVGLTAAANDIILSYLFMTQHLLAIVKKNDYRYEVFQRKNFLLEIALTMHYSTRDRSELC